MERDYVGGSSFHIERLRVTHAAHICANPKPFPPETSQRQNTKPFLHSIVRTYSPSKRDAFHHRLVQLPRDLPDGRIVKRIGGSGPRFFLRTGV